MRVIPVIDLKDGIVVHGVAGQRSRYQPIRSVLVGNSRPDWSSLRQIADSGLKIWLDAGVGDTDRLRELMLRREWRVQFVPSSPDFLDCSHASFRSMNARPVCLPLVQADH